jgi:hypothetical protein
MKSTDEITFSGHRVKRNYLASGQTYQVLPSEDLVVENFQRAT